MDVSSEVPDTASKRCDAHLVDGADVVYQREESQTGKGEEEDVSLVARKKGEKETYLTADLLQQPHQIRVIVHKHLSESSENVISVWITELKCGISIGEVRKGKHYSFIHNA